MPDPAMLRVGLGVGSPVTRRQVVPALTEGSEDQGNGTRHCSIRGFKGVASSLLVSEANDY